MRRRGKPILKGGRRLFAGRFRATKPNADELRRFPIAEACDDTIAKKFTWPVLPWTREHAAIDIGGFDGISDSGQEIYNFCKQEGITILSLWRPHQ